MKLFLSLSLFTFLFTTASFATDPGCREIQIKTEKIGEAVHWMPEKIEVHPGEKVTFVAKHDLEGGFDYHGLLIPALKVSSQVDRHKVTRVDVSVPKDFKVGEYPIGCQFHPKHVGALLIVKPSSPD